MVQQHVKPVEKVSWIIFKPTPTSRWHSSHLEATQRQAAPFSSAAFSSAVVVEVERPGWRAHSAWLADCLSLSSASTLLLLQTDDWSGSQPPPLPVSPPLPFSAPLPLLAKHGFFFRERGFKCTKLTPNPWTVFLDQRFFSSWGENKHPWWRGRVIFLWNASIHCFHSTNFELIGTCRNQIEGCRSQRRGVWLPCVIDTSLRTKHMHIVSGELKRSNFSPSSNYINPLVAPTQRETDKGSRDLSQSFWQTQCLQPGTMFAFSVFFYYGYLPTVQQDFCSIQTSQPKGWSLLVHNHVGQPDWVSNINDRQSTLLIPYGGSAKEINIYIYIYIYIN